MAWLATQGRPWKNARPRKRIIDGDPAVRSQLKVLFIPEYDVTLAEHLIPGGMSQIKSLPRAMRQAAPAT